MRRRRSCIHIFFLLAATHLISSSLGGNFLMPSQSLADDDAGGGLLISPESKFELCFFSPDGGSSGNRFVGIRFHNISDKVVVWVANRERPITDRTGRLNVTANGTLVITEQEYSVDVWSSAPKKQIVNPVARLLDSGNLVVAEAGDDAAASPAWESFDFPTDTVLPGMRMLKNATNGVNHNMTAWASGTNPAPGEYVTGFELDGDPQLFTWFDSKKYWRGGPWNGLIFTGIPEMASVILEYDVTVDPGRAIVYSYRVSDPTMLSRFTVTSSGLLQHLLWVAGLNKWTVYGFTPRDECDSLSPCGPNGVCNPWRQSITCECLRGFLPRNGTYGDVRDWANGCVRRTPRDCRNGTDGFATQTSVKLPDTGGATVDRRPGLSLEQCKAMCLRNCSCTACASANISGGSGCIMWTSDLTDIRSYDDLGQDLYVRVAAVDLQEESSQIKIKRVRTLVVIILVPTAVGTMVLAACGVMCAWKRNKRRGRHDADEEREVKGMDLPLYDLSTIVEATGNFSDDNKLGQGGFGPVYKGKLAEDKEIAVKRLSKTSKQGVEEFKNEMVLIAKLQHRNLVRLLGCCVQGGERMLIYEYMTNGSLDALLFDERKSRLLDWSTRYSIIVGIARGLLYLHHDSRFRIIHRDLKAGNILLDKDMKPKISDFGMARIFGGEESEVNTKRVVGTYGYMSPEYAMDGIFSIKSDVFSFGVLVLEIISGKRNRGIYQSAHEHLNLIGHVWSLWIEGRALEIVDKSIGDSFPGAEVLSCVKIGLLCVQETPSDRPTISSIIKLLGNEVALLPEPKQPGFLATKHKLVHESDSSSSKKILSINQVSVTVLEGR